jgi:hypothetical protein
MLIWVSVALSRWLPSVSHSFKYYPFGEPEPPDPIKLDAALGTSGLGPPGSAHSGQLAIALSHLPTGPTNGTYQQDLPTGCLSSHGTSTTLLTKPSRWSFVSSFYFLPAV